MSARVYVEGGGDSKELNARCREGFWRLFERSGLVGRMLRFVACGGRTSAFDDFRTAHEGAEGEFVALLVDSEERVADGEKPWDHLQLRDGWQRPQGAVDDQGLLMITCMETWIASDHSTLREHFGAGFRASSLPAIQGAEGRSRHDVLRALERATRDSRVSYKKGRISFELLAKLSPDVLSEAAPAFARVVRILDQYL